MKAEVTGGAFFLFVEVKSCLAQLLLACCFNCFSVDCGFWLRNSMFKFFKEFREEFYAVQVWEVSEKQHEVGDAQTGVPSYFVFAFVWSGYEIEFLEVLQGNVFGLQLLSFFFLFFLVLNHECLAAKPA